MKNIAKKILNKFGYEIRKIKYQSEPKKSELRNHGIEFLSEENFKVDFTKLTLDGNYYFVPKYALHRPAVQNILNGMLYEPKTHVFVERFCSSFNGSMVHAGTFFGDMIPNFSRSVSGKVYAFEPVFENYILTKLCIDDNKLSNVILINAALSDCLSNLHIHTSEGDGKHAGGSSTIADTGAICAAINIDRLVIEDLVLIQLDVEGHELIALKGAESSIQKCRPVVAIEDNKNNCSEFLINLDYESVGQIPGLTIWVPTENRGYKDKVLSLM